MADIRPAAAVRRALLFAHRWLGVALCLIFVMWFGSALVMMYWDYPSVTEEDRIEHSPPLALDRVNLSAAQAFARVGTPDPPEQARLWMFDARPAYRFSWGRRNRIVYADTGEVQHEPSREQMARIASAWSGRSASEASREEVREADQWTVQGGLGALRPLWKFTWPAGDQVYVSSVSGEVVQATTRASRFWSWLGPIPHWMYFLPLRRHGLAWTRTVVWTSGIATGAALLGLVLGVWFSAPRLRVPYRGQKRWHTIFGLVFGISAITWAFSGLLSMEPFAALAGGDEPQSAFDIERALRGDLNLASFPARSPTVAAKEIELLSFHATPLYLAHSSRREKRLLRADGSPFDTNQVVEAVRGAAPQSQIEWLATYDRYYLDRHFLRPLPVILVRTNEERLYVDPQTLRITGAYTPGDWTNRWLYHGLHSLNFPWLYAHRPLWDIVVATLLAGGCALSVTSVILAWRVVRR